MRVACVRDALVHYEDLAPATTAGPVGAPLVLIHALGTDARLWDPMLARWPSNTRRIRFDLRGHGLSSCPPAPYTIDQLVDDAAALLDHLDVGPAVLVGVSLGGMIAQGLAARHRGRARALVLSNSAAKMGTAAFWNERVEQIEHHGLPARADAIVERWFAPGWGSDGERIGWRNLLARTPAAGYIGCCRALAGADLSKSTATLTLPTLVIAGGLDQACPPDEVRRTADLVPGARFACIDEAAHLPCLETPDAFVARVHPFVKELTA